ncbi:hypothetical protein EDD15DRAFT_2359495 [Pisolithus albus]|nr:hypothetical protein EDD15DRAFT_2359495 [Pisolithus albus]
MVSISLELMEIFEKSECHKLALKKFFFGRSSGFFPNVEDGSRAMDDCWQYQSFFTLGLGFSALHHSASESMLTSPNTFVVKKYGPLHTGNSVLSPESKHTLEEEALEEVEEASSKLHAAHAALWKAYEGTISKRRSRGDTNDSIEMERIKAEDVDVKPDPALGDITASWYAFTASSGKFSWFDIAI